MIAGIERAGVQWIPIRSTWGFWGCPSKPRKEKLAELQKATASRPAVSDSGIFQSKALGVPSSSLKLSKRAQVRFGLRQRLEILFLW